MLRKIIVIAWKDALLRFSSKAEWIFFIILPVVFTVILAGGAGPRESDERVRLVVVDQAASPLSQELLNALQTSTAVRPEVLSLAEAEEELKQRRVSAVLVIPAGFTQAALSAGPVELELRQRPSSSNALVAARAVEAVSGRIGSAAEIAAGSARQAETLRPFANAEERQAYLEEARKSAQRLLDTAPPRVEEVRAATVDPVAWDPRVNSSAGQMITWVFIPLIGLAGSFAFERQKGTLRRLLTSPTHRGIILWGTIAGQVLLALVQMFILVVFGALVLGFSWGRDPLALGLLLLASALAASALGVALGVVVKTEGQANGLSIMLGMVMGLLGGCWYPLELFPAQIQRIVHILPTTWAMQGLLDLALRGQGLAGVLPEIGVLLGFALVFYTFGVLRFRYE